MKYSKYRCEYTQNAYRNDDADIERISEAQIPVAKGGVVRILGNYPCEPHIGNFKNDGKAYQSHKTPIEVLDHDFPLPELGKATPFGVYGIFKNQAFVNVGLSSDTAAFAVESIRR
jgi:hypothetical protein